jgi:hypothetical protein
MKLVHQELIRMLRLNFPFMQLFGREILEISGNDEVSATFDGGGQYVAIVLSGKSKLSIRSSKSLTNASRTCRFILSRVL